MARLRPFFSFYGSKWTLAPLYAAPQHDRVIECFAGSAGYATLHNSREVLLVDKDPVICSVWEYLIGVSESEMLALPVNFYHVDELSGICPEAKLFLGFWISAACSQPCKQKSKWARLSEEKGLNSGFWSEHIRARVASQIDSIRHWQVLNASYADIPEQRATYFVDPPYQEMGKYYRFNQVDFAHLGAWCKDRALDSQIIACEAEGANWLPFFDLRKIRIAHLGQRSGPNMKRYTEQVCYLPEAVNRG